MPGTTYTLNRSFFIRRQPVSFYASNLRPDVYANVYIDDTLVNKYTQSASKIVFNDAAISASNFKTHTSFIETVFIDGSSHTTLICPQANSFATVVKGVSPNTIYVDDNFLKLQLGQYGTTPLTSSSFVNGQLIYQTGNNSPTYTANTFSARVAHWFHANNVLVVSPTSGTANTLSTSRVIHSVVSSGSGSNLANLSSIQINNKFPAGATISSNPSLIAPLSVTIDDYDHKSGIVSSYNSASSPPTVNLASNITFVNNIPIKIVSGTGMGQSANITGIVNGTGFTANLDAALTNLDHTSRYTIGELVVDEYGNLSGIINIPETSSENFRTGTRRIKITDANSSSGAGTTQTEANFYTGMSPRDVLERMSASSGESSTSSENTGTTVTINQTVVTTGTSTNQPGANATTQTTEDGTGTPSTATGNRFTDLAVDPFKVGDPVAQTFFTPKKDYGMYVTSVDLFFKSKPLESNQDPQLPVIVKIVNVANGIPGERMIGWASVQCNDVKTTDGVSTFPSTSNTSTQTKFTFADPIFLNPTTEYALVVYSDSPSYEVWTAELGETIIGDPDERRVSEQPYIGSFFRSQNASTWTPYQNEDLMFRINRAVFDTSPVTVTFNTQQFAQDVPYDEIIINATELEYPKANINHKFKTTLQSGPIMEASFSNIQENRPYWFAKATDSLVATGRRRVIPAANTIALQTQIVIDSDDDAVSPFLNFETYNAIVSENLINNGELYNSNITITNPGYHDNASNVIVTISDSDLYPNSTPSSTATANVTLNASGNVVAINIINNGKGYTQSPTITISEPGVADNATAVIISEDSKSGGNAICRYMTKRVTLADGFDSGDLRVTVRGIRPQGTNILVYYKVQSESDSRNFSDIKWRKMYLENDFYSPDLRTAIDFKYNPSSDPRINKLSYKEDNVTYPLGGTFKYFAIKIVLLAECGCAAPIVRNLRVISLPEG